MNNLFYQSALLPVLRGNSTFGAFNYKLDITIVTLNQIRNCECVVILGLIASFGEASP
jgi:hypothetical protein